MCLKKSKRWRAVPRQTRAVFVLLTQHSGSRLNLQILASDACIESIHNSIKACKLSKECHSSHVLHLCFEAHQSDLHTTGLLINTKCCVHNDPLCAPKHSRRNITNVSEVTKKQETFHNGV